MRTAPWTRDVVLSVNGMGKLCIDGIAVANAIHHATGKQLRGLPIVMDKLFA